MYNRYNFHKYTFCVYHEVAKSEIVDLAVSYTSKSGSVYYITNEGVYRQSNHWGRVANCRWRLITLAQDQISQSKIGYARWEDFYKDNETEALYFIQIIKTKDGLEVNYQHKDHKDYQPTFIVRTGAETGKRIKQINEILYSDLWAKYLDYDNIETAKDFVVQQLITTNLSLHEIKRRL